MHSPSNALGQSKSITAPHPVVEVTRPKVLVKQRTSIPLVSWDQLLVAPRCERSMDPHEFVEGPIKLVKALISEVLLMPSAAVVIKAGVNSQLDSEIGLVKETPRLRADARNGAGELTGALQKVGTPRLRIGAQLATLAD